MSAEGRWRKSDASSLIQYIYTLLSGTGAHGECATFDVLLLVWLLEFKMKIPPVQTMRPNSA